MAATLPNPALDARNEFGGKNLSRRHRHSGPWTAATRGDGSLASDPGRSGYRNADRNASRGVSISRDRQGGRFALATPAR